MKSFLRMLLVAGVFAFSLAAFQDEARAEEMLSSWYGPGLEGNLTALMGCQVADGCLEDIWVVPELAEADIALITEQTAYLAAVVVMVYAQAAFFRSRSSAKKRTRLLVRQAKHRTLRKQDHCGSSSRRGGAFDGVLVGRVLCTPFSAHPSKSCIVL